MRTTRRSRTAILVTGLLAVGGLDLIGAPDAIAVGTCPVTVDGSRFASAEELRAGNQVMADLGPRPTGSDAHEAFIQYLEGRIDAIDGLDRTAIEDTIERQLETSSSLQLDGPGGPTDVPVAGPVPYSRPVPDGVTAPLVLVPTGTAIDEVPVMGAIVVRPAPPGAVPFAVFAAVAYAMIDRGGQLDLLGSYERDWLGAATRIADIRAAEASGAAGLLFVSDLPRNQIEGQYAPYEGVRYDVPALYLGGDEGLPLVQRLATGAQVSATIRLDAERQPAPTRTVVATLPGRSAERIVVQSHTDGMNAVWDNGPIAMLALAEHLAAVPLACRPRTIQFVFTTAHLHLSHSGAERYAAQLDAEYDTGTVAFVAAIEHLGAREFVPVARTDGGPGRRLVPTGKPEMLASFVSESPVLALNLIDRVVQRELPFTLVLRGADAPQLRFPPHRSFGGEGGPYREHLIPTVAAITGPWTLFNPAFGLDELVDPALMRRQAMVFGDVILANSWVPREILAGLDPIYRLGRDLLGADPLELLGLPPIDVTALPGALLSSPLFEGVPLPVASRAAVRPDDAVDAGTLSAGWFCDLLGLGGG